MVGCQSSSHLTPVLGPVCKAVKLKTCTVKNALKLRYGTFWNAKLARRFQKPLKSYLGKASDGKCPLCKNSDPGRHVLGACTYRLFKELYIESRNETVATAGKAIMEVGKGGCLACVLAKTAISPWIPNA